MFTSNINVQHYYTKNVGQFLMAETLFNFNIKFLRSYLTSFINKVNNIIFK